ncbi:helix-turn-helix domain-containing protein [Thermodesulfobacteriota bacterium]
MMNFGQYVKQRIRALGKSQKALAGKLDVSPAYISQILTGKKNPPDLGRIKNRNQLRVWAEVLHVAEDEILEVVRFQLHRVPPRPLPKFRNMRELLLTRLSSGQKGITGEIRGMELHPAETMAIHAMVQIYLITREEDLEERAYGPVRFKELCGQVRTNKEFVDGELVGFFSGETFSWHWNAEINDVQFSRVSTRIKGAIEKIDRVIGETPPLSLRRTVPVVGHVSAGEGFVFTDGGYPTGEGFDHVEMPPGIEPNLAERLYCVKVRGDSLQEFINEGALLFIKPESWEEIRDGDLVIFKERSQHRAFVKKVEFAGDSLILKSMNPMYKNIVLRKGDLVLLERVLSIVL